MKKQTSAQKPFFAQFLENQHRLTGENQQEVQGGELNVTLKHPSDHEDDNGTTKPLADNVETHKYPSDSEDNPGGATKPLADAYETHKYPSDADDDISSIQ